MDEKQNFITGMIVTIPNNLNYTQETYGMSESMIQLIGTSQKIEKVFDDGNFEIKRWLWDKRDFKISEPLKKTKARKVLLKDLISR